MHDMGGEGLGGNEGGGRGGGLGGKRGCGVCPGTNMAHRIWSPFKQLKMTFSLSFRSSFTDGPKTKRSEQEVLLALQLSVLQFQRNIFL
jgi:hypothetical protein